jgi:uncharacterized protein (TIGR03437 family)
MASPPKIRLLIVVLWSITLSISLCPLRLLAEVQTLQWVRQFGGSQPDSGNAVAADASGGVRKFDSDGNQVWSREIASSLSIIRALAVGVNETSVYVAGGVSGALPGQTGSGGIDSDAYIQKYDLDGNLQWTRQFGTNTTDSLSGVFVGADGVYVAGFTGGELPGQINAGDRDAFVRKYDFDGNELWTRQFGTSDSDSVVGLTGDVTSLYVVGQTAGTLPGTDVSGAGTGYVRKYDLEGNHIWSRQYDAIPFGISADGASGVYVGGNVLLEQQNGPDSTDAFVRKYDSDGLEDWTRQFRTQADDTVNSVFADGTGVYIGGSTEGTFPGQVRVGEPDLYARNYDSSGVEKWTLQFGTANDDYANGIAKDGSRIYYTGFTEGTFPTQMGIGSSDAFLVKLVPLPQSFLPAVSIGGVVNNASYTLHPQPMAAGSIAAIFGTNLNDGSIIHSSELGQDGKLVTSLGGASVTVDGIPAPIFYSTPFQLGIQIPVELAGMFSATVRVTTEEGTSAPHTIFLDEFAPGIFTTSQQGIGRAAALHEDGESPITGVNPARLGEVVTFFATGLGGTIPPLETGEPSEGNQALLNATVFFDGIPALAEFTGTAPGFVGLNQINVRIPVNATSGPDVPIVLNAGGKVSNEVTLPIAP